MTKRDYVQIAHQYCLDVIYDRILTCEWVKKAVKRQLDDLENQKGFVFDETAANRVCKFIECLTHVKGNLAGQRIHLEPWQVFILTTVFGWKTQDGRRRFRRVYIEVPRGNGKSCLSSGVALYCLCADKEPGAEIYSFATTRDQAKIVFGDAKRMAEMNKDLRSAFGLEVLANALYLPSAGSTFQPKSAEGSTLDGLNTHLAVIDELHAHKTRAVYDVVETSLGKRLNSLMWVITTAGFDKTGICYEVRSMVTKVLSGAVQDETQFGIIYSIDKDDDWTTEEALEKANPNWNISVRPEVVGSLQRKAMAMSSAANNFLTKHLNVWVNADSAWMDMRRWDECADHNLSLDEFEGQPCFIGLDLASKIDICAKVLVFPRIEDDGKTHYYVFPSFWLPRRAVENAKNSQYSGWERQELLNVSEGEVTDFRSVKDSILEDCSRFDVQEVDFDPWQAAQLSKELEDEGVVMVEVRQTVLNMSDPMKSLQAAVYDRTLHHDGGPVLTWMMSNVIAHTDAKDNIYPRKEFPENKIDGVVALIMAINRAQSGQREATDTNLFLSL
ncbi:MAG: terminase large subunit [Succinivibrio sp.]|nr:terminase large subunit [Succinivibrio sp.]